MTVPPALRSARGPSGPTREVMRQAFKWANQRVMLPILHNHVVGPWVGSPVIGYFATLTTIGRCSGLPRQTPLNYAILDGRIYLLSGFGVHADWYRNLIVNPRVTRPCPAGRCPGRRPRSWTPSRRSGQRWPWHATSGWRWSSKG